MCKKQLQAEIAAYEVTEGTVTYCTLPNWEPCRKEVRNSRTKNFVHSCWCCGRGIDTSKGGVAYVHLRIDGGLFRVDSEMTDAYEQDNSQGWFPVGNACKSKYPGYWRVLG
jgi:hypothetical protein